MTDTTSRDVLFREARERAAFGAVATEGRSASRDEALVFPQRDFDRLLGARTGTIDSLEQMYAWAQPLPGARVLEICCHDGEHGVVLARGGADVTAVDLVPELVRLARRRAEVNGVADKLTARVMSVHALELPSDSFDIVFGRASLHHLDLELARREIFRVLRPGGWGIFSEPVSLSPWLSALRARVPVAPDRESPDERPLDEADLARFTAPFAASERVYFRLTSRLGRVALRLHWPLSRLDRALLEVAPSLSRYAGVLVFRVQKPARPDQKSTSTRAPSSCSTWAPSSGFGPVLPGTTVFAVGFSPGCPAKSSVLPFAFASGWPPKSICIS